MNQNKIVCALSISNPYDARPLLIRNAARAFYVDEHDVPVLSDKHLIIYIMNEKPEVSAKIWSVYKLESNDEQAYCRRVNYEEYRTR